MKEKVGASFPIRVSENLSFNFIFLHLPNHADDKLTKLPDFETIFRGSYHRVIDFVLVLELSPSQDSSSVPSNRDA